MNKNAKIKNIKLQIEKLQKELKQLETNVNTCKIYWTDMKYNIKHVTTVEAKNETAAKKIFKNKQLNYVRWDAEQGCGAWNEVVPYVINKILVK